MEKLRDIDHITQEDEFSIVVLQRAKKILGEKGKYLKLARMVKLVTFVSEDIGYGLTRGWYRYGDYSPNAYLIAKDYSDSDLATFEPLNEVAQKASERFQNQITAIDNHIRELASFFVKDQKNFYTWVYSVKAPEEYRGLYQTHQQFTEFLNFLDYLRTPGVLYQSNLDARFETIEPLVTDYYDNVRYIKDKEILELFYAFMDLFEAVIVKIRKNRYRVKSQGFDFLWSLKDLYYSSDWDLWSLLVPYSQTLTGMRADAEKERHQRRVSLAKLIVRSSLDDIYEQAELLEFLKRHKCYGYDVYLMEEESGFSIKCPALPGCVSQGEAAEEAVTNMRELIPRFVEELTTGKT